MRLLASRGLLLLPLLASAHISLAAPHPANQNDERDLLGILSEVGEAAGNLTKDVGDLIADATTLIQTFVAAIQEIKNVSTENDLVHMLGINPLGIGNTNIVKQKEADTDEKEDDDENNTNNNNNNATTTANTTLPQTGTGVATTASASPNCPGMAVLFARGTTEPGTFSSSFPPIEEEFYFPHKIVNHSPKDLTCKCVLTGNVGIFAGPSFFTALRNYINGSTTLAIQGVDYPASVAGFLAGGSPGGSEVMAALANMTMAVCPKTKLVLSGYSQGAQVVHNAMKLINLPSTSTATAATTTTNTTTTTTTTTPNTATALNINGFNTAVVNAGVSSVVLFGDPRNGTAIPGVDASRVMSICNPKDDICAAGGDIITLAHLMYNQNAPQAAMFAMQKTALGLASTDATNQGMGNVPTVAVPAGANAGMKVSPMGGIGAMMGLSG